ncbi:N-terminal Xaa-Pro-Lys N-methyltransferase 1-like [Octopus vulgaris]|uniref:N-terminal Xaa-Pro-Lys N-methyltransferase 1-like n=2 Tax=Octopus TaxID=6643 RepID=A0AA36F5R5_OCTVU|nr:N-terminal Xaa-Pro-Lys N-methyltransferase 1-B [Octopus sinensis]CAI9726801.1 N-terminal Xaa-Pro-Lys N-methyltransferase 1-like [Octopus vulgaris]
MASREGEEYYENSRCYWEKVPATIDGMLGGFPQVSPIDIKTSSIFLRSFLKTHGGSIDNNRALDCGAGIGRVTKHLLTPLFNHVDMLDLNQKFLSRAETYLGDKKSKVDRYICNSLQDFVPEPGRYNVIWCQWVLGYLSNSDFVSFLKRCKAALVSGGLIAIKENVTTEDRVFDETDSCFTRPKSEFINIIKKSGMKVVKIEKQDGLPAELFAVYLFAMQ